jgi:hypothetical protein
MQGLHTDDAHHIPNNAHHIPNNELNTSPPGSTTVHSLIAFPRDIWLHMKSLNSSRSTSPELSTSIKLMKAATVFRSDGRPEDAIALASSCASIVPPLSMSMDPNHASYMASKLFGICALAQRMSCLLAQLFVRSLHSNMSSCLCKNQCKSVSG